MKKLQRTAWAAAGTGLLLAASAYGSSAWAQASVYLECTTSDTCSVDVVTDPGTPTPLGYRWAFQVPYGVDATFPRDCTNKMYCSFYCLRHPGTLIATITVKDAAGVVLGAQSQSVRCTAQAEA